MRNDTRELDSVSYIQALRKECVKCSNSGFGDPPPGWDEVTGGNKPGLYCNRCKDGAVGG